MPLSTFSGTLGYKKAAHLLRRAAFGATRETIDAFANMSVAQAVSRLFSSALPDPVLPIDPATGTEWISMPVTDANSDENQLQGYFNGWLLAQMMGVGIAENQKLSYTVREK